jgi:hypothetical protein
LSGAIVRSVAKLARITFLSLAFSYWIDYLGFITGGKLAAVLITPSLGIPNWSVIYIINTAPSWTCGMHASTLAIARIAGRSHTSQGQTPPSSYVALYAYWGVNGMNNFRFKSAFVSIFKNMI